MAELNLNSIVRRNLMSEKGYTPYCGGQNCSVMPRTKFNGQQFVCPHCKWTSQFEPEFIQAYKNRWSLNSTVFDNVSDFDFKF